ncbi:L-fucose:H+ symporter permease [Actinobacillus pleuropneumoniae]|uniref:L-fucose permease n=2 Tax=Actinobacillus TaxID=713 RepID=A0A380U3U3_ACTLI|nr:MULTISPECIES: L-fucose:H+ symporter permease [Actinobacillus]MCL7721187.1 L-fucose:H+ symporter permease [Actinobacillus pleuropneumoniae]MCL7727121.1 L-fucose:H+ symporter permease [Actinobacillus pleuropneumoniae]MCL7730228.1 L-fucose:H+ symporter permease [Actinobacillus pleuropneumoniae]MCY6368621.1 L-fucose:H+ symporter permease [Actinobacillus pleuropneumoniae]MCY6385492.1 L-fucose:H+ symporter permease [Actinobacillus pleuropneumoniae]
MTAKVLEKKFVVPFILITTLFALWGFANDITNPMVAVFQTVMEIPASEAALVQFAFYGGYGTMAIPAALFASRYSYKAGVLLGLALYAIGAFLFIPAAKYEQFSFFLWSLYILTFGLAFLETTANPFILSMGDPATATRRLNLAQSFNPLGSITGMFVASQIVLTNLESEKRDAAGNLLFNTLSEAEKAVVRTNDLEMIRNPYVAIGIVVLVVFIIIALYKMPATKMDEHGKISVKESFGRLIKNARYREGVIAQVFYVGVQIMCWTFIIQYAERIGLTKAEAQNWNIAAMALFISSRFISTAVMKYLKAELMLFLFAVGGFFSILGVMFIDGMGGLYCLVLTSGFMSLMFPTIYGIALDGQREESALGAAGLVMAIVGGALMPPLQGSIIDMGTVAGMPAVNFSFILPLICFVAIAIYGFRCWKVLVK